MATEEAVLAERAAKGDQEAIVALLGQHGPSARNWLNGKIPRHLRSVLSEDDVMQQTYADAFVDIARFECRGEGSFLAWLTTLANSNLKDAIRMLEAEKRGGNRRRVEQAGYDESFVALYDLITSTITSPTQQAARNEAKTALQAAIAKLPDNYGQVITLYDLEGRSLEEVARAINKSHGAVCMMRARVHVRLAELMGRASQFLSTTA